MFAFVRFLLYVYIDFEYSRDEMLSRMLKIHF